MPIRVALNHKTHYTYDRLVTLQPHVIRLRPAPHCRTPVLSYSLRVEPQPHFLNWQQDPYSNYLARVVFLRPARSFQVEVDLVADMTAINPFEFFVEATAETYPFPYDPILMRELVPYLEAAPAGPRLIALVDSLRRRDLRTLDFVVEINQRLQKEVRYLIRMEPGVQTCEETLTLGSGSCRDSAWLLVQVLRRLGLAARFVSGYLIQLSADTKSLDGPSGPEHDFTDLHAWGEVYLPGAGWIGLDPTSGLLADEGHIPLACAADPTSAAAITGSFSWAKDPDRGAEDRCDEQFHFDMSVTRVHETPRVTRPYTEEQWQAIDALGQQIDEELVAGDVRLTMGGEPTFVSIDDFDSPEWTVAALGPAKRRLAGVLLKRLRDRFAPGAVLHFGQGKWYPGEPLPRWAFGCYWRRDGIPAWSDPALVADPEHDYGHGWGDAQRFVRRSPNASVSIRPAPCRLMKTPGTTCGASGGCRRMSIRSKAAWTMPASGAAWPASSSRGWAKWSAMLSRCGAGPMTSARAGRAAAGSSARNTCFFSPATRPWATACRWTHSPGSRPGRGTPFFRWTPSRPAAPCRPTGGRPSSRRRLTPGTTPRPGPAG